MSYPISVSLDNGVTWQLANSVRVVYGDIELDDVPKAELQLNFTNEGVITDLVLVPKVGEAEANASHATKSQTVDEIVHGLL
jgi:hypothetical protein